MLADGSTRLLDRAKQNLLARQGGSCVLKMATGQRRYAPGSGAAVLFNTVATPCGELYQLTLPDGSRV
jgi:transmembrane sensor